MKKLIIVVSAMAFPMLAFAQTLGTFSTLTSELGNIIGLLIPIAFALGLLLFFWGLAVYILSAGDSEKKEEGRNKMIWGIVALFVMASVWGLVIFLQQTFGIQGDTSITVPTVTGLP